VLKWILLLVSVGLIYFWFKNKGRAAEVEQKQKQKPKLPRQSLPSQKKSGLAATAECIYPARKG
jgi:hypothetical protein